MSRTSEFTAQLADTICERIAEGQSLRAICADQGMPAKSTVFRWLGENKTFQDQYARAREAQAEVLFDENLHIADTPMEGVKTKTVGDKTETQTGDMIEHRRLQVDARKWMLGKMQPKKYGEKLALTGADGGAIEHVVSAKEMTDDELARIALGGSNGASEA